VVGLPFLAIMVGVGLLVGWQPHRGLVLTVEALLLIMLLRYALSWVGVYVGLVAENEQVAAQLVPLFLPITRICLIVVVLSIPSNRGDLSCSG
jgi:ABC-2 type transport system permease protein